MLASELIKKISDLVNTYGDFEIRDAYDFTVEDVYLDDDNGEEGAIIVVEFKN